MKRCTRCGETKPLDEFHIQIRHGAWGEYAYATPECGPCRNKLATRWVQANRERRKAYHLEWQREYRRRRKAEQDGSA